MAGSAGQSGRCTRGPGFPRGTGFSLCFCPHPTSVLLPVTQRAPGALAPSLQLHLGRRRGGSPRVCKTQALFHTLLASLGEGGGTVTVPFPAPCRSPHSTASSRGMRDASSTARIRSSRRSPHYLAAKESEQVTSPSSPPRPASPAYQFFTGKMAPSAEGRPEGMPSCQASLCHINI